MVIIKNLVGTLVCACCVCLGAEANAAASLDDAALSARSMVSAGDPARLQQALAKARRGETVTVAVIGGSITQGAAATTPEKRYGNLVAAWWRNRFPKATIKFINAGIGATGSNYGAFRAKRDLLIQQPDFVVAEYAVNDGNTKEAAETLEGLVRQILQQPNQPALVLLFTMHRNGGNAQEWQGKVGAHYALPMISFRDALWPEIEAGRAKWEDVEADVVHPNDRGHAYCAQFIGDFLAKMLTDLPAEASLPAVKSIPKPFLSDLFESVALYEADGLKPVANSGWTYDAKNKAWQSSQPGSTVEFELEGSLIYAMHYVVRGPMGQAKVTVDGGSAKELNGWFDQTWGGYRRSNEIARNLPPGRHRVRLELLANRSPESTGNEFRLLGLSAAGVKK